MKYIISGTFDPLHPAHLGIAEYLERECDIPTDDIYFECSHSHCDKTKTSMSFENRMRQFNIISRVCLGTPWAGFVNKLDGLKSREMGRINSIGTMDVIDFREEKVVFCMGEDTFHRFLDVDSYFGSEYERARAMEKFRALDGAVLVLPRGKTKMIKEKGRWQFHKIDHDRYSKWAGCNINRFVHYVAESYVPKNISSSKIRMEKLTNKDRLLNEKV